MAELNLAQKLALIKATIVEVKVNPLKNVAVVSVKLTDGKNTWFKPLGVALDKGVIKWADFKARLQEEVKKTYTRDKALLEIKAEVDKEFNLFS